MANQQARGYKNLFRKYINSGVFPTSMGVMQNIAVLIILVLLVGFVAYQMGNQDDKENNVITVSGTASMDTAPDEADISIGVQTLNKDAAVSQKDNADIMAKVMSAIESAGIPKEDISTSQYSLYELKEYDPKSQQEVSKGYQTTNTVIATAKDLSIIGTVIDAAANAGANNIGGITFKLSKDKEAQVKNQVLALAAQNGKDKAIAIATSLKVMLGKLSQVSETQFFYNPVVMESAVGAKAAGSAPTPLTPSDVTTSATLTVVYEVE
jgi:uncharacterized protein